MATDFERCTCCNSFSSQLLCEYKLFSNIWMFETTSWNVVWERVLPTRCCFYVSNFLFTPRWFQIIFESFCSNLDIKTHIVKLESDVGIPWFLKFEPKRTGQPSKSAHSMRFFAMAGNLNTRLRWLRRCAGNTEAYFSRKFLINYCFGFYATSCLNNNFVILCLLRYWLHEINGNRRHFAMRV